MKKHKHTYQVRIIDLIISKGVEGSEGITAMSVSPSRKYVAVCEKAERAICLIWDISQIN